MNSIKTNKGNKANGQPAGTNKEKKSKPCFLNPTIVAPSTMVKLRDNVKIKWLVEAKLYGLFNKPCICRQAYQIGLYLSYFLSGQAANKVTFHV